MIALKLVVVSEVYNRSEKIDFADLVKHTKSVAGFSLSRQVSS